MVEILRVSHSGDSVIYKDGDVYHSFNTETNLKSGGVDSLSTLTASGGWRRATQSDKAKFEKFVNPEITVKSEAPQRKYRLPKTILESLESLNFEALSSILTVDEMEFIISAQSKTDVGMTSSEIAQLNSLSKKVNEGTSVLSPAGQSWINKIEQGIPPLTASGESFDDDDENYYATSPDPEFPTSAQHLYKVDEDSNTVFQWVDGDFVEQEMSAEEFNAPVIIPIDNVTAQAFALWLNENSDSDATILFNLEEAEPAENNLMKMNEDEIEEELSGMLAAIDYFAPTKRKVGKTLGANWAKMMVKSYTPAERSANAKKQKRNSSGQFSPQGNKKKKGKKGKAGLKGKKLTKGKKAKLSTAKYKFGSKFTPEYFKTLQKSLDQWAKEKVEAEYNKKLKDKGKKDSYLGSQINTKLDEKAVDDTKEDEEKKEEPKTKNYYDEAYIEALRQRLEEFKREREKDDSSSLTAAAESDTEAEDTRYLALISPDDPDAVTDIVAMKRADGELTAWVRSFGSWVNDEAMRGDIMGVTPPPMVELEDEEVIKNIISQVDSFDTGVEEEQEEIVEEEASLYSEFGDLLPVSAAAKSADGVAGTMRLKRYWTVGKGAAKIRWGSKGDLTRCHRHLSKYLGPKRAWGYCQNRHQDIFGMSNAKKDRQGK